MQQVAKHLGLGNREAPGVQEYERTRKGLGLVLSAATIIRRWEVWREVCKAAQGEQVSMTARQRAHFRAAIRQKQSGEEWLTGVREWLHIEPAVKFESDYDAWADERNENKAHLLPVSLSSGIREALGLSWSAVLQVAKRDLSLVDAQRRHLKELKQENGEFVTLRAIALIHGITTRRASHLTHEESFPAHAFTVHSRRVWYLADIEAHHSGQPFPRRTPGELQDQIMSSKEIREMFGELTKWELRCATHSPNASARIPPPAGQVNGAHYWFRIAVEAWCDQRPNQTSGVINAPSAPPTYALC